MHGKTFGNKVISFLYKWNGEADEKYSEVRQYKISLGKIPRGSSVRQDEYREQLVISWLGKTHMV